MIETISNLDLKLINQACQEFFLEYENELNKNVVQRTDPAQGLVFYKPTLIKLGATQTVYNNGNAFFLEDTDSSKWVNKAIKAEELPCVIIRRIVGYKAALDIQNGIRSAREVLLPLVYEMLSALKRDVGFDHTDLSWGTVYATFKRPGSTDEFFREASNSAGLELRLFSDALPVMELDNDAKN